MGTRTRQCHKYAPLGVTVHYRNPRTVPCNYYSWTHPDSPTRTRQQNKKTTIVLACNNCRIMLFGWRIHCACPNGPGTHGNRSFCWCDYHTHFCPDTNPARCLGAAYSPFNIPAIQKGSVVALNHRAAWTAILGRAYYRAGNCLYCSSGAGTILTQIPNQ